jgi:hypothetical protein
MSTARTAIPVATRNEALVGAHDRAGVGVGSSGDDGGECGEADGGECGEADGLAESAELAVWVMIPVGQGDSAGRRLPRPGSVRGGPAGCRERQSHDGVSPSGVFARASLAAATTSAPNRMI